MKNKILYWTPRVLGILFAVFISIFALDVFGEYGFPEVLVALFMHLIPTFLIVGVLLIAWKWNLVGGILYIGLGLFYIGFGWGKFEGLVFLIVAGPAFLTGLLFILNRVLKNKR